MTAEYQRAWRAKNPEKTSEYHRAWRAKNPDKAREMDRRSYAAKDPVRKAYLAHKRSAKQRNIPFLLTFNEWWAIWEASGHWEQRGFIDPDKYCMARPGDRGPYSVGNVYICTNAENFAANCDIRRGRPLSVAHRAAMSKAWEGRRARQR
jgi:hypothetical protein